MKGAAVSQTDKNTRLIDNAGRRAVSVNNTTAYICSAPKWCLKAATQIPQNRLLCTNWSVEEKVVGVCRYCVCHKWLVNTSRTPPHIHTQTHIHTHTHTRWHKVSCYWTCALTFTLRWLHIDIYVHIYYIIIIVVWKWVGNWIIIIIIIFISIIIILGFFLGGVTFLFIWF